jgi:plastocyanin
MARTALLLSLAALTACGSASDTGMAGPCQSPVNGCTSYVDLTASTAEITFASFSYTPKCAEVKVGQTVTFTASGSDFGFHPLAQTCGPELAIPSTNSGTTVSFSFSMPGTYGYHCTIHGGSGMTGAIEVVP